MNVYKVPSAVFSMNIFNIAEESRFAHQYSQLLFLVNNGSFKTISWKNDRSVEDDVFIFSEDEENEDAVRGLKVRGTLS